MSERTWMRSQTPQPAEIGPGTNGPAMPARVLPAAWHSGKSVSHTLSRPITRCFVSSFQCLPRSSELELPQPAQAPPGGRGTVKRPSFSVQYLKEAAQPEQRVSSSYLETLGTADALRALGPANAPSHRRLPVNFCSDSAPRSSGAVTAHFSTPAS